MSKRYCSECHADITHRRIDALTCSEKCRKKRQRRDNEFICDENVTNIFPVGILRDIEEIHIKAMKIDPDALLREIAIHSGQDTHESRVILALLLAFQRFKAIESPSESVFFVQKWD